MEQRLSAKDMNANQFISYLEGLLAAQDKETKLSKAIRAKLTQVSRDEEWSPPYFKRDYSPPVIVPLTVPNTPPPTDWRDKPYC